MATTRQIQTLIFSKVNPAVKFSVTRYVLAIGIFVAICTFGLVCTLSLGTDLMPNANIPNINVSTSYSGATPQVVNDQITQMVENSVSTLAGITDISSQSSTGNSRVSIAFDMNVDKNVAMNQVASAVASVTRRLPTGAGTPTVQAFDPNSQPILEFGISAESDLTEVGTWADDTLVPLLQRVPGVAAVSTTGDPTWQFQVLLNPAAMSAYRLNPSSVTSAISSAALNQAIGTINSDGNNLTFSTRSMPTDPQTIAGILVDPAKGIRVSDVATVHRASASTTVARVNGQPVVLVSIQKTSDANSVAAVDAVKKLIGSTDLPKGYQVWFSTDTTAPIRGSINATLKELLMTLLVVAIIVLLFLGKPNTAFSVILAIPIALSASPILYQLSGWSFNIVSLLAMIVAIGIVVDDSIVVAENVERYRKMGYSLKESVFRGASEVFSAVVAASLSLLSVLVPASFMGGFIGRYLTQFSMGLAVAVAFSLLEAVLFLTVRLAYTKETPTATFGDFFRSIIGIDLAIKDGLRQTIRAPGILLGFAWLAFCLWQQQTLLMFFVLALPLAMMVIIWAGRMALSLLGALTDVLHRATEWVLEKIRDAYVRFLERLLPKAWMVILIAVVFLGVSLFLLGRSLSFNLIPQADNGMLSASLRMPSGTVLMETNEAAGRIENYLSQKKEILMVQTTLNSSGTNASMNITLVPRDQRANAFELSQSWRKDLQALLSDKPSARISVSAGGFGGPGGGFGGNTMSFNIQGGDFGVLQERDSAILAAIEENQWVTDASSSLSNTAMESNFVPEPALLKGTGLTPQAIAGALQSWVSGTQATTLQIGGKSYPVTVLGKPELLRDTQSLLNLPIYSPALGTSLTVSQLGSFNLVRAPQSVARFNRLYVNSINITLAKGAPPNLDVQNQIRKSLTDQGLLDGGLMITNSGSFGTAALTASLATTGPITFLIALFLAYLVMAAQFNSWRYPVYLLTPVPLALVGALFLVVVTGGSLDIFGLMGLLMLIGLSAKNAILYLDFVVERLGTMPLSQALLESASLRFRPIIMTTMTVLVISFPLILGQGDGSEYGQRLGVVMLGGILSSAILTFFVVPSAFSIFEAKRHLGPLRKPEGESGAEPDPGLDGNRAGSE